MHPLADQPPWIMRVKDGGTPGPNGLPVAAGMSTSHWLQTVRSNPLLDHRTTSHLPESTETVVIGSGVSILPRLAGRPLIFPDLRCSSGLVTAKGKPIDINRDA